MSKQDRQGVRTASDLERKYDLGTDYTKAIKIANDAQRAASNAQDIAANASNIAMEAKNKVDSISGVAGLSVVDGMLCITYEEVV